MENLDLVIWVLGWAFFAQYYDDCMLKRKLDEKTRMEHAAINFIIWVIGIGVIIVSRYW